MTEVTKKIRIDLANPGGLDFLSTVHVVQGDAYSRFVAFELYSNGEKYTPPEGTTAIVRYKKSDDTGGNYDVLPDGSAAYTIEGNILKVALAPQLCIVPGIVQVAVGLIHGDAEINTFSVSVVVQPNPGLTYQSKDHVKLAGTVADSGWEPNMYLGTDSDGNVTAFGTDKTMTKPGRAADAKATGDAVGELKEDLSKLYANNFIGYQFLKDRNRTENQYYERYNTITAIDENYATYEPIKLNAGTYYVYGMSYYFSWVEHENGTVRRIDENNNITPLRPITLTFEDNVTLYITSYNSNFEKYPMVATGYLSADNLEGAYGAVCDNLLSMTRWRKGSINNDDKYQIKDYIDEDYRYITSCDMMFDYPVVIENTDTTKYGYYTVLMDYGNFYVGPVNYQDNKQYVFIPANTKLRVGIRYTDNRIPTEEEQVYLRKNAIIMHNKINSTFLFNKVEEVENALITVGENGNFSTIQDAVNSINDSSENNRYTILVDVGTYDITNAGILFIPIKPYVTIKGVDKAKCIISFRPSTKDSYKNVFQQSNDFGKGYAEVCNFTLITENIKGGLHLDDASWKGEIYFHDIIIDDISSEEVFEPSLDYYNYMGASIGAINLATHLGQKIVIENVQTNGYIYSHSLPSNLSDMDNENAGEFIVKNCVCDWIGVYGNGEAVRKKCVLENNKCHFIKIAFIDNYNLGVMCWNTILVNNHTDFIASQYFAYGNTSTMKSLTEEYYGRFPFADSNIHKQVQNNSGSDIPFGSKVKFTDYTHRYIILGTENDYDAIACETINNGWYGTVQDGGNKKAYLNYLATHELIN